MQIGVCTRNAIWLNAFFIRSNNFVVLLSDTIGLLHHSTTNRDGYREYKNDPNICANCSVRHLCTHSKDCVKTVRCHVWEDYEELADDVRYTPEYKKLYRRRKETIERAFADAKEKHAMYCTRCKGLAQAANQVKFKFATMNLKKLAKWKWKARKHDSLLRFNCPIWERNLTCT